MRRSLRSTTQTVLNVNEWAHKLRDVANDDEGRSKKAPAPAFAGGSRAGQIACGRAHTTTPRAPCDESVRVHPARARRRRTRRPGCARCGRRARALRVRLAAGFRRVRVPRGGASAHAAIGSALTRAYIQAAGLDVWLATPERADVFVRPPHTPPAGASSTSLISLPAPIPSGLQDDEDLPALAHLNSSFHSAYHPLGALGAFARALEEMAPDLVSRRTYGYSAEGRALEVLHVRDGAKGANASVLVAGSPHAREVRSFLPSLCAAQTAHTHSGSRPRRRPTSCMRSSFPPTRAARSVACSSTMYAPSSSSPLRRP
jgi:hypothetical protein